MNDLTMIAPLISGLGLFFIGVRSLSANLVPLIGRRARASFAEAMRGPASSAVSGILAGMVTQSSTAVSWIVLGLFRTGMQASAGLLAAPSWSNVGTALLPVLVAVNFTTLASYVIGLAGFAIYFKFDNTDRRRNMLNAALGAAMLLFGMHIVSANLDPLRDAITGNHAAAAALGSPWILMLIGVACSVITQSSSVAVAIAVAAIDDRLLTVAAVLPLIAGANAAGILNNVMKIRGESEEGRIVFALQVVQKAAGTLLLAVAPMLAAWHPDMIAGLEDRLSRSASGQIVIAFIVAQFFGAALAHGAISPLRALVGWLKPPSAAETLARPVFLLREALQDPPAALDLSLRELARLSARLPLMLDRVRGNLDPDTPPVALLREAGASLGGAVQSYLAALLDGQPSRAQVAATLLLENAAGNAIALHETLADLVAAVPAAATLAQTGQLVEALHLLMGFVADHAAALGAEDPAFVLKMLGDRNNMMSELRLRLTSSDSSEGAGQDALFRMSILFERAVWLARRLVTDLSHAHQAQQAD